MSIKLTNKPTHKLCRLHMDVCYLRIYWISIDTEQVVIVGVHGSLLVLVEVCQKQLGLVQGDLGRGRPLECPRAAVLVTEDAVAARGPVARHRLGHLGLEPVDSCLPARRLLKQSLLDSWTLAGSCHEHLDSLVGAAAVRALAAVDEGEEAVNTLDLAVYHQVKPLRLERITEGLKYCV